MADYTAYEIHADLAMEGVEGYCKHLTAGGSFSDATQPTQSEVFHQLTIARHKVAALLAAAGFSTTQTAEAVLGILQHLNVLEVVVWAELGSPVTGTGEPNERFLALREERDALIELIRSGALADLGATVNASDRMQAVAGGTSKSRKQSNDANSDAVLARFRRGFGSNYRGGDHSYGETDLVDR